MTDSRVEDFGNVVEEIKEKISVILERSSNDGIQIVRRLKYRKRTRKCARRCLRILCKIRTGKLIPLPRFPTKLMSKSKKISHVFIVVKYLMLSLGVDNNGYFGEEREHYNFLSTMGGGSGIERWIDWESLDGLILEKLIEIQRVYPSLFIYFKKYLRFLMRDCDISVLELQEKSKSAESFMVFKGEVGYILKNAEKYGRSGKNDNKLVGNSMSIISIDVLVHILFPCFKIIDLIRMTRVSKVFFDEIWNSHLKNRKTKCEIDIYLLFYDVNMVSDSILSKLIEYRAIDLAIFNDHSVYSQILDNDYMMTLTKLSTLARKEGPLSQYQLSYYKNGIGSRRVNFPFHDTFSNHEIFERYLSFRWRSSTTETRQIYPVLKLSRHVNPKMFINKSICTVLIKRIFSIPDLSETDFIDIIDLFSRMNRFTASEIHTFFDIFVRCAPLESNHHLFGNETLVKEVVVRMIQYFFTKDFEKFGYGKCNKLYIEHFCYIHAMTRNDNLNKVLIPSVFDFLGENEERELKTITSLLISSASRGNVHNVKYLLGKETIRSKLSNDEITATTIMRSAIKGMMWCSKYDSEFHRKHPKQYLEIIRCLLDSGFINPSFDRNNLIKCIVRDNTREDVDVEEIESALQLFFHHPKTDLSIDHYDVVLEFFQKNKQGVFHNICFLKAFLKVDDPETQKVMIRKIINITEEEEDVELSGFIPLLSDERFKIVVEPFKFLNCVFVKGDLEDLEWFFPLVQRSEVKCYVLDRLFFMLAKRKDYVKMKMFPDWEERYDRFKTHQNDD